MTTQQRLSIIDQALAEMNAVSPDHRGSVIWMGSWVPQFTVCSDISYQIFKLLGGQV